MLARITSDTLVISGDLPRHKVTHLPSKYTFHSSRYVVFAWEAHEHGTEIHPQAEPTQLTLLHKEFEKKKNSFKSDVQKSIIDKYGGEEHLQVPPKELLLAQTVSYQVLRSYHCCCHRKIMLSTRDLVT